MQRIARDCFLVFSSVTAVLCTLQSYLSFIFTQMLSILLSSSKLFAYIFTIHHFLLLEVYNENTCSYQILILIFNINLIWNLLLKSYQFFSKCQFLLKKSKKLWLCSIEDCSLQSIWILDDWGLYLLQSHYNSCFCNNFYPVQLPFSTSVLRLG